MELTPVKQNRVRTSEALIVPEKQNSDSMYKMLFQIIITVSVCKEFTSGKAEQCQDVKNLISEKQNSVVMSVVESRKNMQVSGFCEFSLHSNGRQELNSVKAWFVRRTEGDELPYPI